MIWGRYVMLSPRMQMHICLIIIFSCCAAHGCWLTDPLNGALGRKKDDICDVCHQVYLFSVFASVTNGFTVSQPASGGSVVTGSWRHISVARFSLPAALILCLQCGVLIYENFKGGWHRVRFAVCGSERRILTILQPKVRNRTCVLCGMLPSPDPRRSRYDV